MHGVEKSAYTEHNLRQVEEFKSHLQVLDYGTNAAAHARSEELVLVTNNLTEFERIEGLKLENWVWIPAKSGKLDVVDLEELLSKFERFAIPIISQSILVNWAYM